MNNSNVNCNYLTELWSYTGPDADLYDLCSFYALIAAKKKLHSFGKCLHLQWIRDTLGGRVTWMEACNWKLKSKFVI